MLVRTHILYGQQLQYSLYQNNTYLLSVLNRKRKKKSGKEESERNQEHSSFFSVL